MEINRRHFLRLTATAALIGPSRLAAGATVTRWLSCRAGLDGSYYLTVLSTEGFTVHDIRLPARGHGIAVRPDSSQCAVLARRPGTFFWVVDVETGDVLWRKESPADRHYFGHGAFDSAGRLFYATENDFTAKRGVVGVYDAADGYRRVGEFPSYGVGPHELKFLPDARTLVVANGGIHTHPDFGRRKLNLADMAPNLAYIDSQNGELIDTFEPPEALHKLSIRHLDITPDGHVVVAMQWKGPANARPPLVGVHRGEEHLRLLSAPAPIQSAMRNYCGSVCADSSGQWFAVSAPRGNLITFWSSHSNRCHGGSTVLDGCGIAADTGCGQFTVTSGEGGVFSCQANNESITTIRSRTFSRTRWDNHLSAIV